MKYIIHMTPKRDWYVKEFLVPSMLAQGIDKADILYWNDTMRQGNLTSFVRSCDFVRTLDHLDGSWHMQDDVVISDDFKARTEQLADTNHIVCGFFEKSDLKKFPEIFDGYQVPKKMGISFQCIYIPNYILCGLPSWFNDRVEGIYNAIKDASNIPDNIYANVAKNGYIKENRNDDQIFKRYLLDKFPDQPILNLINPLVQHIDYLIGGSVIYERKSRYETANFDEGIVERLKQALIDKGYLNQ